MNEIKQDSKPFTYFIGWSNFSKYYYGVRYAEGCSPEDLWSTYFTSSKVVKAMRERYGNPDIIQVRKTFNDPDKAKDWERKVLRRMDVVKDQKWLNLQDGSQYAKHTGAEVKKISKQKFVYEITTPEGETLRVYNGITIWCSRRGLSPSSMQKVAEGYYESHKGYTAKALYPEDLEREMEH